MKRFIAVLLSFIMILGLSVTANAQDGNKFTRISCTVNGETSTQRGFCWYSEKLCSAEVRLSLSDNMRDAAVYNGTCAEWEGLYTNKVLVTTLQPGTVYYYQVGDGESWSSTGTFKTDDGDSNVNFAVLADVQASSAENFTKGAAVLEQAFDTASQLGLSVDFVANLGDFTNDSINEEWNYYADSFDTLNQTYTLAPVAGNHDGLGVWHWFDNMFCLDTSESVQTLNGINYSFDYGNVHVAVLNTNDMLSVTDAQLKWLENDMNSTAADWKVIFMHKSPYTLGKDGKWPDALYLQKALTEVCDKTNVDLVMSGHDHMYLRTKLLYGNAVSDNGTAYVLAGTAGTKRYEIRSFLADSFLRTSFIDALTVQKNGYANYWDGEDWDQSLETNVGGCFSLAQISTQENMTSLTLRAFILSDENNTAGENVVTQIDSVTFTKSVGENTATFSGDNSTGKAEYTGSAAISLMKLAFYAVFEWLGKFLLIIPEIISAYSAEGTF